MTSTGIVIKPGSSRKRALLVLLCSSILFGAPAFAQTTGAGAILGSGQVSIDSLEDELALPDPARPDKVRGFREIAPNVAKPYKSGRVNLLITFVSGSSTLTSEAQAMLDTLAKAMKRDTLAGVAFRVVGHADARGDPEVNRQLSLARATAVAAYLHEEHSIIARRLIAEGRGSAEPLNTQRIDAPENRRVTFISTRDLPPR